MFSNTTQYSYSCEQDSPYSECVSGVVAENVQYLKVLLTVSPKAMELMN